MIWNEIDLKRAKTVGSRKTMTKMENGNGKQRETTTQRKRRLEKARQKYKEKQANENQEDRRKRLLKRRMKYNYLISTMGNNFDEIDSEMLIEEIKNYPEIWNMADESYHDRVKKRGAWTNVCQVFSEGFEEKDDQEKNLICNRIVRKWRNLRDAYIRNLKLKTKSAQSRKQYIYGEQLSFLLTSGIEIETQTNFEDNVEEDTGKPAEHQEQKKGTKQSQLCEENSSRKRKRDTEGSSTDFVKNQQSAVMPAAEPNSDRLFFDSIIPSIKDFTEDQKLELRCEILNLIKRLRMSSCSQNSGYSPRTSLFAPVSCPTYSATHSSNYLPQHEFNRSFQQPVPHSSRYNPEICYTRRYSKGLPVYLQRNESQQSPYSVHNSRSISPSVTSQASVDIQSNSDDENLDLFKSSTDIE